MDDGKGKQRAKRSSVDKPLLVTKNAGRMPTGVVSITPAQKRF
jgi:hypothetical protein